MNSLYGQHLPIFPHLGYDVITEERIERAVEHLYNRADRSLMNGKATQEQYDAWSSALSRWSDDQYDKIREVHLAHWWQDRTS